MNNKVSYLAMLVLILTVLVLTGCDTEKVEEGWVRDTIYSVEPTVSGVWSIFMTHDESVVFCTPDDELGQKMKNLLFEHDGEVILWFKSLDWFKNTSGETFGVSKCANYYDFTTVILTDASPVPAR